jgi:hypothetical protein
MLRILSSLGFLLSVNFVANPAIAQSVSPVGLDNTLAMSPKVKTEDFNPDFCINRMAEFPSEDHEIRYQFFRLTEEMARDVTPEFRNALHKYGYQDSTTDRALLEVIEDIANPVLRQAAPDITITNMAHVIDFATLCKSAITGQVNSLSAYDNALNNVDFNAVIVEDALFLRQILSDSLFRLGANEDLIHGLSVTQYADALVTTRDEVEFTAFESELDDLEALYMDDLDGRLKRSNDIINEEMDHEILGDSVALSDSMNEAEKKKAKQRQLYTLIRILGGGG